MNPIKPNPKVGGSPIYYMIARELSTQDLEETIEKHKGQRDYAALCRVLKQELELRNSHGNRNSK